MSATGGALESLVASVVGPRPEETFGAYLLARDEPGAELARAVERAVFLESFGNTPEMLASEYAPYEDSTVFACIIDHRRMLPVGMMRIVVPSPAGLKSLNDIESIWGQEINDVVERTAIPMDLDRTWDVATLAVMPDYRAKATGGLISMGLYQTLNLAALRCGMEWLIAVFDVPVFRLLSEVLCMSFAGFTGIHARPYLGSPASLPAWCNIAAADLRISETDPHLHAILFSGTGLETALRPVDVTRASQLVA